MISTCNCYECKFYNYNNFDWTCKAYPKGIPHDILFSKKYHEKVLDGQVGNYIFERLSEKELDKIYKILEDKESEKSE